MAENIGNSLVTCATGNCTWPIIPTVGVCGACVNMTDKIRVDMPRGAGGLCNVTAPGDLLLPGSCTVTDWATIMTIGPGSGEVFKRVEEAPSSTDSIPVLAEFGVLGIPANMPANTTINHSEAAECALWYCLQARRVSIVDGELHDDVVETWNHVPGRDGVASELQLTGETTFEDIPDSFNTDPDEKYGIVRDDVSTLRDYFSDFMIGNATIDGGIGIATSSGDFAEAVRIGLNDIDAWIARFAKSMTNNIRSLGFVQHKDSFDFKPYAQPSPDLARYTGTARSTQIFFVVYWSWLAYPAAIVALAALFVGFEATRTSMLKDVRPWKDDIMVPLSMSLDESSKQVARAGLMERKGASDRLGNVKMAVTRGDDGFPTGFVAREG